LSDYLELGYIPAPATTWSGVRKVPPGHLVRFSAAGAELHRWFETPVPGSGRRPSRIAVRARLEQAVRRRLADLPATLLSGGLDSSALVALMTRLSGRVRTYAAGNEEDLELARRSAERFRSGHRELRCVHPPAERPAALLPGAGAERARAMSESFNFEERAGLLGTAARTAPGSRVADLDGLEAALAFDLEVSLPDDVLFRLDVAANGRDVRTPFVDVDLAQAVV